MADGHTAFCEIYHFIGSSVCIGGSSSEVAIFYTYMYNNDFAIAGPRYVDLVVLG